MLSKAAQYVEYVLLLQCQWGLITNDTVFGGKKQITSLQFGSESWYQADKFQCLGDFLINNGRMELEVDQQIKALVAVMRALL